MCKFRLTDSTRINKLFSSHSSVFFVNFRASLIFHCIILFVRIHTLCPEGHLFSLLIPFFLTTHLLNLLINRDRNSLLQFLITLSSDSNQDSLFKANCISSVSVFFPKYLVRPRVVVFIHSCISGFRLSRREKKNINIENLRMYIRMYLLACHAIKYRKLTED